jgi:hypothetical protein
MCDSISDVTHYPPPQDFIDGSPGHLLQRATKAPTIHLVGVLMAYQRVHYAVQMLRMAACNLQADAYSFASAGLCRDALDISLRNEWIFAAASPDAMLGRMAASFMTGRLTDFHESRALLISEFTREVVPALPTALTPSVIAAELTAAGIAYKESSTGEITHILGEPTRITIAGRNGVANQIDPIQVNRYRALSSFSHGEAAQAASRIFLDHLDEGKERGTIPMYHDIPMLIAILGSTGDTARLLTRGLYSHLGWNPGRVDRAATEVEKECRRLLRLFLRGKITVHGHAYGAIRPDPFLSGRRDQSTLQC